MPVHAPTFPLDESAFRRALRTGHGRAVLHVHEHGAADLAPALIEAALRSPLFDNETEESRAPWIDALIVAAGLEREVLAALAAAEDAGEFAEDGDWDRSYRAEILAAFAARGSDEARQMLYASIGREQGPSDVVGWHEVIALDGAYGLLVVARKLGRWLAVDPGFVVDEGPVEALDETLGEGAALAVLGAEASEDADVARYLEAVQQRLANRPAPMTAEEGAAQRAAAMRAISAAEFIARIRGGPAVRTTVPAPSWAKYADATAIEQVFAALLEETDPYCVRRFLTTIAAVGPPRFDERLVAWTDSDAEGVSYQAMRVLAGLSHPRVRELALANLAGGAVKHGAVGLLRRNFVPGDFARIEALAWPQADDNRTHWLGGDVLDVADEHVVLEAAPSLLLVYEHSRCGICRARAVQHLLDLRALPDWVATEARHDANERVCLLVRRRKAARRR